METILYSIISLLTFLVGFLLAELRRQRVVIIKAKKDAKIRKEFLDKVFYMIELNESINIKQYFDQVFEEMKIEKDNVSLWVMKKI